MELTRFRRLRYLTYALCVMLFFSSCNLQRRAADEVDRSSGVGEGVRLPGEGADAPEPEEVVEDVPSDPQRRTQEPRATPRDDHVPSGALTTPMPQQQRRQAWRYLNASVPRLVIEIDWVQGADPDRNAVAHMRSMIAAVADKPRGVEVVYDDEIPRTQDSYSTAEVEELVSRWRNTHDDDDTASVYVIYVPGSRRDAPNTLGYASGTRIAMFPDRMHGAASASTVFGRTDLERAVLVHEMGHLLSLVNIGYASPRERTDPNDPNQPSHHNRNRESVMYYAVNTDAVSRVFLRGPPPSTFDRDDLADLEDVKHGRL